MSQLKKAKLTGLWERKTKKEGATFWAGSLSIMSDLVIFKNAYKNSERDPDYIAYVAEKEYKPRTTNNTPTQHKSLPFGNQNNY